MRLYDYILFGIFFYKKFSIEKNFPNKHHTAI